MLADIGDIQVHLRARCTTTAEAEALLEEVGSQIERILGDRIYTREGEPLEAVVGKMLSARGETLSVVESCTGGMLGERITSIPGSSGWFVGGLLTYSDAMKIELAGVDAELLRRRTAVSEEVAVAMAAGGRERTGATWTVAITGYAGPPDGGEVFIGIAGPSGVSASRIYAPGERQRVRRMATQAALDLLRRKLFGVLGHSASVTH